jgi:RNA polymerase-binding protein DksA
MANLDEVKRSLEEKLSALTGRLSKIEAHLRDPGSKDSEERAVEAENEEVLERLDETERAEIQAIRTALERIGHGTYGVCSKCGGEIESKRLGVLPYTTLCVTCIR